MAELYPPNEITDEGLAGLAHLPNLKELFLYGSKITDAGLVHFKPLQQLEFLGIQHTRVTGSGLVHLQGLANLAWLDLSYTQIGDPRIEAAGETLPAQSRGSLRHPGLPGRHPQNPGRPAPLHGAISLTRPLQENRVEAPGATPDRLHLSDTNPASDETGPQGNIRITFIVAYSIAQV